MAIVTRASKGSALTHAELDNNFTELASSGGGATLIEAKTFYSSGTWTKPANANKIAVVVTGGSAGGGGGSSNYNNANGGGGGGGGCMAVVADATQFGATETVTVGGGGSKYNGNSYGGGGSGGQSSFGGKVIGNGGNGSNGGSGNIVANGGNGGTGSTNITTNFAKSFTGGQGGLGAFNYANNGAIVEGAAAHGGGGFAGRYDNTARSTTTETIFPTEVVYDAPVLRKTQGGDGGMNGTAVPPTNGDSGFITVLSYED